MTIHDNTVPAIDCVDFVRLVDDLVDSDPRQWGPIVAKHLDECPRAWSICNRCSTSKCCSTTSSTGKG